MDDGYRCQGGLADYLDGLASGLGSKYGWRKRNSRALDAAFCLLVCRCRWELQKWMLWMFAMDMWMLMQELFVEMRYVFSVVHLRERKDADRNGCWMDRSL